MTHVGKPLKVAGIGIGTHAAVDRQFFLYQKTLELQRKDMTANAKIGIEADTLKTKEVVRR